MTQAADRSVRAVCAIYAAALAGIALLIGIVDGRGFSFWLLAALAAGFLCLATFAPARWRDALAPWLLLRWSAQ